MRKLLIALAFIVSCCGMTPAYAQSCPAGYTLVSDTLYGPVAPSTGQPTLFFGTVTIAANSAGTGVNGAAFGKVPIEFTVSNGVLNLCVIPNDTATPANTVYLVRMAYDGDQGSAPPWTETWSVPTSVSPVALHVVRLLTVPAALGASPMTGFTGTKTAGACTFTISNGVITSVTGC